MAKAGEGRRLAPGRNRDVQVVRVGARKLFDAKRKQVFLEWFAATSNVKLSAAQAGVAHQTVFKHRMKDPDFADAWDRALQQGYARLEARMLAEALQARIEVAGDLEVPETEGFDPVLGMQLLKEHRRTIEAPTPFGASRKPGRPQGMSREEVRAALIKRLVVFGIRVRGDQASDSVAG